MTQLSALSLELAPCSHSVLHSAAAARLITRTLLSLESSDDCCHSSALEQLCLLFGVQCSLLPDSLSPRLSGVLERDRVTLSLSDGGFLKEGLSHVKGTAAVSVRCRHSLTVF